MPATTTNTDVQTMTGGSTSVTGVPQDAATIARNKLAPQLVAAQSVDPTLGTGATVNAVATNVNDNELADPTDSKFQIEKPGDKTSAATQQSAVIQAPEDIDVSKMTASTVDATPESEAQAAIGNLPPEALLSSQMEELTKGLEKGETPLWARPAEAAVEAQLAARGLSRSSVGQAALTNAIIQAALPIAQGNAQAVNASFQQNVQNQQQANMQNAQMKNQHLLSDAAAKNAASQFNATSQNQADQFMANLKTSVDTNNATRTDAMGQFNAGSQDAMAQFNANLQFNSDKFNKQNATVISQSTLNWRRQANSQTTASQNAANMENAKNAFGLQQDSMDKLWQEMRDNAEWTFQAAQNDNQIKSALIKSTMDNASQERMAAMTGRSSSYAAIGGAAYNILSDTGFLSGIGDIVGGWFD